MTALLSVPRSGWARSSGKPMSQRKVGDSEHSCEPFFDGLVRNRVRQDHANPAAKIFDASDAEVLQRPLDIAYEPLLEIFPVAAFEGEFVVMDDGAAHGLSSGMLKMAANFVLGSTKSSTYPRGGYASGICLACGLVGRPF